MNMSRKSHAFIASSLLSAAVLFFFLTAPHALAQHGSEGTVTVTVLDPTNSVVPGAELELRDLATSLVMRAETSAAGTHTFVNLPLGTYTLSVTKQGFKSQTFQSVAVQAGKTTDLSANLSVGAASETVQVTTNEAPLVETTTNQIGTVVDMTQIEQLPIQGRDLR